MLNFEHVESSGFPAVYRAEYRGLTIKAVQDTDCANPWHDSDGLAPLLWHSLGNSGIETDCAGPYDIESPLGRFTDRQLALKWRPICQALGADPAELQAEIAEERRAYGGRLAEWRRDKLESFLADLKPSGWRCWSAACDYFEALESLWRLAGIEALDFQRNGYSQGDSVRGLLVALPEWREAMGIKPSADMAADLKGQADLFGAWAFGDCYGFVIESPDGETLDSCWGYIGGPNESGLAEAAKDAADSILARAAERRTAKLKALIRNRVPVGERPAILAEAGKLESAF